MVEQNSENYIRIISLLPTSEIYLVKIEVVSSFGSEKIEFSLLKDFAEELLLEAGEIKEELLYEIEYKSEVTRAYLSACSSIAYSPSSLKGLLRKLIQKGFPRDAAEEALAIIKERGFVNESEIALRRAELCVNKHWGRSRIILKLKEEGFSEPSLSSAREYLSTVDFAEHCALLIKKKFGGIPELDSSPESRHERDSMFASLSRMGYSASDIKEAIRRMSVT